MSSNISAEVVIVDGSKNDWSSGSEGYVGLLYWKYLHLPGEFNAWQRQCEGIREASGEYICFLDDQDLYLPVVHLELVNMMNQISEEVIFSPLVGQLVTKYGEPIILKWGHWSEVFDIESSDPWLRARNILLNQRSANFYYLPVRQAIMKSYAQILEETLKKYKQDTLWFYFAEVAFVLFLSAVSNLRLVEQVAWLRTEAPQGARSDYSKLKYQPDKIDLQALNDIFIAGLIFGRNENIDYQSARLSEFLNSFFNSRNNTTGLNSPSRTKKSIFAKFKMSINRLNRWKNWFRRVKHIMEDRWILLLLVGNSRSNASSRRFIQNRNLDISQEKRLKLSTNPESHQDLWIAVGLYQLFPEGLSIEEFQKVSKL